MASKIVVLDEKVANQIAAGEVIERPASIVKELVENSIDAGSTRIQVEIQEGGRSSIRVLDNGEGISREDVLTAFERHATSKIREASDLFSIRTLGFRGEALPSIAAVSRVTLQTRTADEPVGTYIKIEGGEVADQREVGMAAGTDFLVEDLFFNTPARLKYMKTTNTELAQISDIFNSIAIAHPHIAMSLAHNGRLISRTPGTGRLKDVIYTIYGREIVDNLLEIDYAEHYIKVAGFVSRPTMYRSSRKHQSFYVNGRYVRSIQLSRAVSDAYANLMPDNRHAVAFLFVRINPVHVDVNVHPAKLEVKFSRPEMVGEVVTKGIRQALIKENMLPAFRPIEKVWKTQHPIEQAEPAPLFSANELTNQNPDDDPFTWSSRSAGEEAQIPHDEEKGGVEEANTVSAQTDAAAHPIPSHDSHPYTQIPGSAGRVAERLAELDYQPRNWDPLHREQERRGSGAGYNRTPASTSDSSGRQEPSWSKHSQNDGTPSQTEWEQQVPTDDFSGQRVFPSDATVNGSLQCDEPESGVSRDSQRAAVGIPTEAPEAVEGPGAFIAGLLPIGQIHQTYIIAQGKDGFYVIDQHVAHERVLYEELMETFRTKGLPSQTLLIPLTLELTVKEIQVIQENTELFHQIGFGVEHFGGNTIILRAVPKRIDERPDKDLFLEIVDLLLEDKKVGDRAQLYNKLITSMSCKGAIKAGERLEQGEMIRLLQNLSRTQNPRFCPHGRPILFHISEKDLLKAFQRI